MDEFLNEVNSENAAEVVTDAVNTAEGLNTADAFPAPIAEVSEAPLEAPAAPEEMTPKEKAQEVRRWKARIRSEVNHVTAGFLAYYGVFNLVVGLLVVILLIPVIVAFVQKPTSFSEYVNNVMTVAANGLPYLVALPACIAVLWLILRRKVTFKEIFTRNEKMTVKAFFEIFAVFMAFQLLATILDLGLTGLFSLLGFSGSTLSEVMGSVTMTDDIPMLLYAGFFGPIAEEIIFRGLLQTPLKKFGRFTAIVMTAILFGVMHMNLVQTLFAMGVGLVLGYVRDKYSITWAMLLHIINNALFGILLEKLCGLSGNPAVSEAVGWIWQSLLFAAGVGVIVFEREKIKAYFDEFKVEKDGRIARKAPVYVLTVVLFMLAAVGMGLAIYMF